ncbi:hypothetical protein [Streptomyces noursei]|uniref:hypothetical protein n=1 Tax=Streptomyces noursei TaxID=1971 RepID=UPI0016766BFA|nr:hypothetical protein [Streptomyces noursei]MCZ1021273.1 hypothetical protein [Streptomyces noursei]GGX57562.1 hypothetical protein GCM10010341_91890 [Streptomyces noursei]
MARIKSYPWLNLDPDLQAYSDAAQRGMPKLPDTAADFATYRGTYRLIKPIHWFRESILDANPVTKNITSTSRKFDLAADFAKNYTGENLRTPAIVTFRFSPLGEPPRLRWRSSILED